MMWDDSAPAPIEERIREIMVWERLLAIMADVPDEELAKLPTDGAAQVDHYVYGTPKREEP